MGQFTDNRIGGDRGRPKPKDTPISSKYLFNVGDKLKASDFDKEQYGIEYVTITSINRDTQVYYWIAQLDIGKVHSGYFWKDAILYDDYLKTKNTTWF
jgi:hypothetical protein